MKTIYLIYIFFLGSFIFSSCLHRSNEYDESVIVPPADSADYTVAGKGFYKDKGGNLFILTEDANDFDTIFQYYEQLDSIDLESFEYLGEYEYYAKDKNHVYIFQPDACGMNVFILADADPETFAALNYRWARDKNYVYESGWVLDSLNPNDFYLINTDKDDLFFDYAYDGRFMYYASDLMEEPDTDIINFIGREKNDTLFCRKYEYEKRTHFIP
jgi:hypothetical protein